MPAVHEESSLSTVTVVAPIAPERTWHGNGGLKRPNVNDLPAGAVSVSTDHVLYTLNGVTVRAHATAEIVHQKDGHLVATGVEMDLVRIGPTYVPVRLDRLPAGRHPTYTHGVRLRGRGGSTYALIEEML